MKRSSWLAFSLVMVVGCGGGGTSTPPPSGGNPDAALYAQAVQDYNGKAYSTAKTEFLQLLGRPSATAYHDKSTVYVAAIDYYQGNAATCLSVLGSPTPPTSGFFSTYPASADTDRARYWHGRCELGLTPPAYLAGRADFTAVIGMAGTTYADNAYLWRGRTYYATASATGNEASPDWTSALSDFSTVFTSFASSTVAPEASYWRGRTHFSRGDAAKGRGTQAGDAVATAEYAAAESELGQQPTRYPGNAFVTDATVYLGRTHLEQASYAVDKVAACTAAAADLLPFLGTADVIRDEANYWYGRALYELGLAHETTAVPDYAAAQAQLQAARTQLLKFQSDATLSTSKLADNAAYWVGRCLFSLADVLKTQADFAGAQPGFAAAQAQLAATKTSSQFLTSNVLDLVQVYLGRSQLEQGLCAAARGAAAASFYSAAQTSFGDYFTFFGAPVLPSAASAHYWRGRTSYAQGGLAQAITEFETVVAGWDFTGIASSSKSTTVWWDNSQYWRVAAYSDQATPTSCASARSALAELKAAIPADSLVPAACTYMTAPGRCPSTSCP
jgi:TolA-binding protein